MKRGIGTLFVLAVFALSVVSAYATTINLNTLPDKDVQVYFIENSNQIVKVLNYLDLQSNSSGDVSFGYIGKNPSFTTLISVAEEKGSSIYLLEINKENQGLSEVYNFNLSNINQAQEKNNNEFLFHLLQEVKTNSSENESVVIPTMPEVKEDKNMFHNKYTYILGGIILLVIIFLIIKMSSKKKSDEEEYDPNNHARPIKLYQQEDALVRSAKQKLKEVSSDIKRLKDNQEKALRLRKEMIQRERELSKVKA